MAPDQDEAALGALVERMKALLGPFVLRRTKAEVATQLTAKDQRLVPFPARLLLCNNLPPGLQTAQTDEFAAGPDKETV